MRKATWSVDGAWIVPEKHPDAPIVTSPDDVVGRAEKPFFCETIRGIRANLRFDKKRAKPEFLADIKSGKKKDVSWGYFYDENSTPGEWNGQHYDRTRSNFLVDHVAAGVPVGRCTSPYCGIAVDQLIIKTDADAVWDTEYINNLPDSAFAYIESGGEKDADGKTVPRSKRHLPYKNAEGALDADHVRNALARLSQTEVSSDAKGEAKGKLCAAAKELKIESEVCSSGSDSAEENPDRKAPEPLDPALELERAERNLAQFHCVDITRKNASK